MSTSELLNSTLLETCEVVAMGTFGFGRLAPPSSYTELLQNVHGSSRALRSCEFLGALIGEDSFCRACTTDCVATAAALLDLLNSRTLRWP